VLSQFGELDDKKTLKDFLFSKELLNCYPAGRLDYDSEGLLLLTDDGQLQHRIAHPDKKLQKSYWVQVEGIPTQNDLDLLRKGILLNDGPCKSAKVKLINEPVIWPRQPPIRKRKNDQTAWLEITISEGRNRQVRRMFGAIGRPCLRLIRFKIGPWSLDQLRQGEYKIIEVNMPIEIPAKNKIKPKGITKKSQRFN